MEDEGMSTPTMTSVTEDLSLDETDTSSRDLNTSSQITTSDGVEERNTTVIHAPLLHTSVKQEAAEVTDVTMEEGNAQEVHLTVDDLKPDPHIPITQPSKRRRTRLSQHPDHIQPSRSDVQFPDFSSMQGRWYEHECFDRYWRHYHFVTLWCRKHLETYKAVVEQYNGMLAQQTAARQTQVDNAQVFKKPVGKKTFRNRKARRRRKEIKRLRKALADGEAAASCSAVSQSEEDSQKSGGGETTESAAEGAEKEEMMEITEEMLDFFAHTHKHRQERDALKKNKGKEDKHVNIEEGGGDKKERTEMAPTERPGSRRTSEMRLLYGKGAAMIHGMETALQMTFDRNMDVMQPSLWPNMPLKVIF